MIWRVAARELARLGAGRRVRAGRLWPRDLGDEPGADGSVSALRETCVIMAALIGVRLLREPFGRRRVVAASVVAVGVVLLEASPTG